ncbi:NusG domain II-containing protein [Roseburia sp. 831b]|uniref:NusG domain II-containing protein n=1 Tax=Roseburia sp. 831b TaxID=1261635 RepID=UPI00095122AD|nr:NusG domain II-containing protein [Roseburia sp. 831b]WVK74023.1 NusG domain II-containing protein [Roseburia sp. 831b]
MQKRLKKNDIIFLAVVIVILAVVYVLFSFGGTKKGESVEILIDGASYGIYSLQEEQTIPIKISNKTTNVLEIKDGKADMVEADCPDKLCVHQKAISKDKETIVCLPNKVVVQVIGDTESEFDSVAK